MTEQPEQPSQPLFPHVRVKLTGTENNGFLLAGRVRSALLHAGHQQAAAEFFDEALSGNYDNLLNTCAKYVRVR